MLARGALSRVAARAPQTSTRQLPQLASLLSRTLRLRDARSTPAVRALSRAYHAALHQSGRRAYATAASATKPTAKVKSDVKKAAAKKPAARKTTTKTAAKKTATKKTAAKKAAPKKKTKAAAKPKPKKRVKKPLTDEQKMAALIKGLKTVALRAPVLPRQRTARIMFLTESMKHRDGAGINQVFKESSEKFKSLSPAELEHYNHLANQATAASQQEYETWLKSHTPEQIRLANLARARLRKLLPKPKGGNPAQTSPLPDSRAVKSPGTAYTIFFTERQASGDFKNIPVGEAGKLIGNEWKALNANEKSKYETEYASIRAEYVKEYEKTYGHAPGRTKKTAAKA